MPLMFNVDWFDMLYNAEQHLFQQEIIRFRISKAIVRCQAFQKIMRSQVFQVIRVFTNGPGDWGSVPG